MKSLRKLIFVVVLLLGTQSAFPISFALDSIAEWGKFPRFCVNVYKWGDKFFNTYDTVYVKPTGTKFNVKLTSQSWVDHYAFDFQPDSHMDMVSDVASNVGIHLSYLAVSVGYDMNINRFFNGYEKSRKRVNFAFNCALFGANFYVHNNDLTTKITSFENNGHDYYPNLKFDGAHINRWGLDLYYFLNNKRYSQAAAFNYGRIQTKSSGSFYFGLSYCNQHYNFDFNSLPQGLIENFPMEWDDYTYRLDTKTYSLKAGYAYNWVLGRHWLIALSESPLIGYRTGRVNEYSKSSFAVDNILRCSGVYNNRRFFFGLVAQLSTGLVREPETTMVSNIFSTEFSIGYRFNLW